MARTEYVSHRIASLFGGSCLVCSQSARAASGDACPLLLLLLQLFFFLFFLPRALVLSLRLPVLMGMQLHVLCM